MMVSSRVMFYICVYFRIFFLKKKVMSTYLQKKNTHYNKNIDSASGKPTVGDVKTAHRDVMQ